MPGDALFPRAQYRSTRAITISVPTEEVWPWLVQVGYRRGGWYANDLLDNFARPSARDIIPELQDLHVGQSLAWVPWPSERSAFVVRQLRSTGMAALAVTEPELGMAPRSPGRR